MKNFGLKEVYLHCMNVIHTQYVYTNWTFGLNYARQIQY